MKVIVRATDTEVAEITDRLGNAICETAEHDGACATPWTIVRTPVADLDEPERSELVALLDS